MSVDLRKIKKLIELVEESGIAELEVSDGEESIRIARPVFPGELAAPGAMVAPVAPVASATMSAPVQPPGDGFELRAPMAGTFFQAAEPGGEPFVSVGQRVEAGDVLCIIESMKMMNEITASASGICTAVAVANGQPVASGQVLFRLD
jgi:acetyl-CoA carboxylase biotin carboxyl carrier protein